MGYEAPQVEELGSVEELTQGHLSASGNDFFNFVDEIFGLNIFGS